MISIVKLVILVVSESPLQPYSSSFFAERGMQMLIQSGGLVNRLIEKGNHGQLL